MPLSQTTQRQYSRRPGSGIVVIAVMLSLLSLLPLGFVIGIAIDTGWSTVKALVFRPRVGNYCLTRHYWWRSLCRYAPLLVWRWRGSPNAPRYPAGEFGHCWLLPHWQCLLLCKVTPG